MEKTIEIPEGYEARIEGNKVILEPKESEDERIRISIVETIKQCPDTFLNSKNRDRMLAYLERQKEHHPVEWSEVEQNVIGCAVDVLEKELPSLAASLKSLRPQPKQKWSQEDNDFADDAIACVARCHEKYIDNKEFYQSLRHNTMDIKRWLIKVRKRLTPQWKPSKEQMDALKVSSEYEPCIKNREYLKSLCNDLQNYFDL